MADERTPQVGDWIRDNDPRSDGKRRGKILALGSPTGDGTGARRARVEWSSGRSTWVDVDMIGKPVSRGYTLVDPPLPPPTTTPEAAFGEVQHNNCLTGSVRRFHPRGNR